MYENYPYPSLVHVIELLYTRVTDTRRSHSDQSEASVELANAVDALNRRRAKALNDSKREYDTRADKEAVVVAHLNGPTNMYNGNSITKYAARDLIDYGSSEERYVDYPTRRFS